MNDEQNTLFHRWLGKIPGSPLNMEQLMMRKAWEACLEMNEVGEEPYIPEGYFKIGEEVEVKRRTGKYYDKAKVVVFIPGGGYIKSTFNSEIRRIPAWQPKDGEAVLVRLRGHSDIAGAGVFSEGTVSHGSQTIQAGFDIKPFDASKIGKLWSEL